MTDPTPNTNYATGPGGLFSNPALGSIGVSKRKSKSAQRRAEKAQYKAVQIDPEAHPGAMIALMLTPEQTAEITEGVPGKLAQEADHCTLIYIADDAAAIADRKPSLLAALASLAANLEPVEAVINGYGAFAGNDGQYPLVMLLNSPQLPWLRMSLYHCVTGIGIPLEDRYGFTPHITLTYLPADKPMPRLDRKKTPLRFEAISLVWAGERIDLPLLGKPATATKADTYTPPEAARNNARKVLEWREKYGDQVKGMTSVGWGRARQLASGKPISRAIVARMASFNRHRKNAEVAPEYRNEPWRDAGYVAWLGWGGTTGVDWARSITGANRREKADSSPAEAPAGDKPSCVTCQPAEALKTALSASEGQIATKPFVSRAQQRWAFATDQDFAERWADETGSTAAFRRLPERVARKSKSAQRRLGLLDPAELERAEKAGERIAGQLCRSETGKFVNCNSPQATDESKDKLRKAAADQKKQETAAERAQREKENIDKAFEASGLSEDSFYSLIDFASGEGEIDGEQELLDKGLIEQARDGSYRMTPAGRRFVAAARRGDTRGAQDAASLGADRTTARREREAARAERRAAVEARRADREAKRLAKEQGKDPKKEKPKKGGGGGGGKKQEEKPSKRNTSRLRQTGPSGNAKPASGGSSSGGSGRTPEPKKAEPKPAKAPASTAEDRTAQREQARTTRANDTARRVGLRSGEYDALRRASEGGSVAESEIDGLAELGLIAATGNDRFEATDQGRRALSALERGDTRAYQAALQDARARTERESKRIR